MIAYNVIVIVLWVVIGVPIGIAIVADSIQDWQRHKKNKKEID